MTAISSRIWRFATIGTLLVTTSQLAACKQPTMTCGSARGHFGAVYQLTSNNAEEPCAQVPGDVLGMQTYYEGKGNAPALDRPSVAIGTEQMGLLLDHAVAQGLADPNPGEELYGFGSFTTSKPQDDFCEVQRLSTAQVSIPEVPEVPDDPETEEDESIPLQPATDLTYEWSNARFLVNPDAQGTQFSADLRYTENDCTAEYHVLAVYPAYPCTSDAECDDDTNGINPDFATRCLVEAGLCVPAEEPPSYQ